MTCSPNLVACQLATIAHELASLGSPSLVEWVTLGATLITAGVSLFLGLAALKAARAANIFERASRIKDEVAAAHEKRLTNTLAVIKWAEEAIWVRPYARDATLKAKRSELASRFRIAKHQPLVTYMDVIDLLADMFPGSSFNQREGDRTTQQQWLVAATDIIETWVTAPDGGSYAIAKLGAQLKSARAKHDEAHAKLTEAETHDAEALPYYDGPSVDLGPIKREA
jgi:hypothetical protein